MGETHTGAEWEANAPAWIEMSRAGADTYRDLVNTPAFLELLPDVDGRRVLDVGCGEGHNTRRIRALGADVTALDVSNTFVRAARDADGSIDHLIADGTSLPFGDGSFDAAVAFMSVMDMADPAAALVEMARVVRPGGVVQFSITHPGQCTWPREWVRDDEGRKVMLANGNYFHEGSITETWTFGSASAEMRERHEPFTITWTRRTLSSWLNMIVDAGLTIERVSEPVASPDVAERHPEVADTRIAPYFLIVRSRV
jgi:ubiquinone/menaquinone biosynthesis C-methylase UbiE